ncbi:AraC family transcriptional regulator [Neobacillus sp. YIM B02564]|uniref:AraC family transcriptional regulator n=1 Tax=Neobacillus paridis TaxID=2803862 RepID=A0ABS1TVK5_9BACI|nr:helix-turn-helix domain-containing protein [Neobacillus paridis]MBL4954341.1 AraC family transcriptional regulator [Neobacillus paridis]
MNFRVFIVSEDASLLAQMASVNELLHSPFSIKKIDSFFLNNSMNHLDDKAAVVFFDIDHLSIKEQNLVIGAIKEQRNLHFVILKEHFEHEEIRGFFKNGVFDCLKKPVNEEAIYQLFLEIIKEERNYSYSRPDDKNELLQNDLKRSLAYDLIFGNVKHSKKVWNQSQLAGLSNIPNTCMTICIDNFKRLIENKSESWGQSIREGVIKSVHQYFEDNQVEDWVVIINGAEIVNVLLSLPVQNNSMEFKTISSNYAQKIRKMIQKNTGYSVTIGVGNYYEDARNLHLSYKESLQALANKFFNGSNTVIHYEDVEPFSNELDLLQMQEATVMANQLTIGDFEGVKHSLDIVIRKIASKRKINPNLFKLQTLDLLSTLAHAAIDGGAHLKEVLTTQLKFAKELLVLENLEQICQWFYEVVHQFLNQIISNHNETMLKSVQKALLYINSHYTEEISLESVSKQVHLSPNYFSNIFKKTTGSSFIEYLTHLRMDKAKSMLMDLNRTIYQISEDVGYRNSRYFGRVFKAYMGMTPSEFRNSMLVTNVSNKVKTS